MRHVDAELLSQALSVLPRHKEDGRVAGKQGGDGGGRTAGAVRRESDRCLRG